MLRFSLESHIPTIDGSDIYKSQNRPLSTQKIFDLVALTNGCKAWKVWVLNIMIV